MRWMMIPWDVSRRYRPWRSPLPGRPFPQGDRPSRPPPRRSRSSNRHQATEPSAPKRLPRRPRRNSLRIDSPLGNGQNVAVPGAVRLGQAADSFPHGCPCWDVADDLPIWGANISTKSLPTAAVTGSRGQTRCYPTALNATNSGGADLPSVHHMGPPQICLGSRSRL